MKEMDKQFDRNAEVLCRACLELLQDDACCEKHDIFITPDLAKKLIVCTSLTVEVQDGFPKYLCNCCFNKVNEFHEFHLMCVESVQRFREILQRQDGKYLEFEDEKPVFDLETQAKLEITVAEPEILFKTRSDGEHFSADELEIDALEAIPLMVRRSQRRMKRTQGNDAVEERNQKCLRNKRNKRLSKDIKKSEAKEQQEEVERQDESIADTTTDLLKSDTEQDAWQANEDLLSCVSSADNENDADHFEAKKQPNNGKESSKPTAMKQRIHERRKRRYRKRNGAASDTEAKPARKKSEVYQCDICHTRFFVEHRLIAHKRTHEGLMPYPCTVEGCDKAFNRWHCLNAHLKQHAGTSEWYSCTEEGCGKMYRHKPTLSMHLRKFHKKGPELKSHICEICGKVFKASAILNDHRYTHKDKSELPFVCPEPNCDRRFSSKEKLKVHGMRHAGIKNYVCPYCGLRKTTRNELKIHINYHTLERTWPCRFCQHVCNSAGNLKMHVRTVHERAKDYACRFCERSFAKPDTRKYHEMTHTGEKPNECKECGKRFTQPAALRTHSKIHKKQRAQQMQQQEAALENNIHVGVLLKSHQRINGVASGEDTALLHNSNQLVVVTDGGSVPVVNEESLIQSSAQADAEAVETLHLENLLEDNL